MTDSVDQQAISVANKLGQASNVLRCVAIPVTKASKGDRVTFEVSATGENGSVWHLIAEASVGRALSLPDIYLADPAATGLLAHVSYNGKVCYDDHVGLSIDAGRPADVLQYGVDRAISVLDGAYRSAASGDHNALLDEFEGYWQSLPQVRLVDLHISTEGGSRHIYSAVTQVTFAQRSVLGFTERFLGEEQLPRSEDVVGATQRNALLLQLSAPVLPPAPGTSLDIEFVSRLYDELDQDAQRMLSKALCRARRHLDVVLVQPCPAGRSAMYGLELHLSKNQHPDSPLKRIGSVKPLAASRRDLRYVRQRSGAEDMQNKTVVVIGCGAVGSVVAETLALSGIGRLVLFDTDLFTQDNLFKHVLGMPSLGQNKAKALKQELEKRLPGLKVEAFSKKVNCWHDLEKLHADAVVLATGDATLERELCQEMQRLQTDTLAVFTWVEALGVGGHALSCRPRAAGCLECLYTDIEATCLPFTKVEYIEPGQQVGRDLTGCGGTFIPYSAIHARKTALLAAQLCIDGLRGDRRSRYLSWKGDDKDAVANSIRTTAWYHRASDMTTDQQVPVFDVPCPSCGGVK